MKKLAIIIASLFLINLSSRAQSSSVDSLANQLAQKLKDSLSLTDQQASQIANANSNLGNRETTLRTMFAGSSSLPYYLKAVEKDRDSLYKAVLPNDKYLLYISKKQNIISGN